MGRTYVTVTINGPNAAKDYSFLVNTGAALVGLPIEEIQELGLHSLRNGAMRCMTANGIVELNTYSAEGQVQGQGFVATVFPAPATLVGYEFLENRRFRVNPLSEQVERVPDDEIAPPYLISAW